MRSPSEMILLEDVHPHWHFVKPVLFASAVIDPTLFVREPAVARTRGRPMGSTIKPLSQSALMEEMTEIPDPIERQEEISTQRDPSLFEIVEDIVPERAEREIPSTRGRVASRGGRERGQGRIWGGGRGRGRGRGGRGARSARGAASRDKNGRWVRQAADEAGNQ